VGEKKGEKKDSQKSEKVGLKGERGEMRGNGDEKRVVESAA